MYDAELPLTGVGGVAIGAYVFSLWWLVVLATVLLITGVALSRFVGRHHRT
jgi:hypothetical protein